MTKAGSFSALAMALALGVAGCASAQPKEPQTMLIDKLPTDYWNTQTLLAEDQYKEQQEMVAQVGLLLNEKYKVTASRFYELKPDRGSPQMEYLSGSFHNTMGGLRLSPVFENSTIDKPFLTVWRTSGFLHHEYVAMAVSDLPDKSTLLGYFELEPKP